jgi:hypothetical protein
LCLGLALWNERDPILKERAFGLTGAEANHGEDVKDYWWYLDAVPSHTWNRWRYHYPQAAFPYENLRVENGKRGKRDPEYELLDTGVFDGDRYWIVEVHYAKADPTDLLMSVQITNAGSEPGSGCVRPDRGRTPRRRWGPTTRSSRPGVPRPTSSMPSSPRRPHLPTRRWSCARPCPGCCGASSCTITTSRVGSSGWTISAPWTVRTCRWGGTLEQSDATGWMATYALAMTTIAAVLHYTGHRPTLDLVQRFLEHFADIRSALDRQGMWDDGDGLFYDRIVTPGGGLVPVKVHSMVGIIPMPAVTVIDEEMLEIATAPSAQFAYFLNREGLRDPDKLAQAGLLRGDPGQRRLLMGVVGVDRLKRMFSKLFDPEEFLSPYGLRALSAVHRDHPYEFDVEGVHACVDYEPAESTTDMFGGNSNWRGPVWFPLNYLTTSALERHHRFFGDDLMIEYPTGSGYRVSLDAVARTCGAGLCRPFWSARMAGDPALGGWSGCSATRTGKTT